MNDERILADWRALMILGAAQVPHSSKEIAEAIGISIVDTHRKVRTLSERGYLSVAYRRHGRAGSTVKMWISTVSRVWISFMSGVPRMQVGSRSEMVVQLASERR